ncbi:MAG: hypothetical protein AAB354_09950 [candidate division KSB1 bacterium]
MACLLHILIFIDIIIAISLNLIAGHTGILSIAHAVVEWRTYFKMNACETRCSKLPTSRMNP